MKHHLRMRGALDTVVLGVLAAAVASGCGSDANGNPGATAASTPTGTASASITAVGGDVAGCDGTAFFDIQSDRTIQFVGIDRSDLANATLQLFDVTDTGTLTQINKSAQEADASMQSLVDARSKFVNAAKMASEQAAQNSASQSASTSLDTTQQDKTTTKRDISTSATNDVTVTHFDSHDASHSADTKITATTDQFAKRLAEASSASESAAAQAAKADNSASADQTASSMSNSGQDAVRKAAAAQEATNTLLSQSAFFGLGGFVGAASQTAFAKQASAADARSLDLSHIFVFANNANTASASSAQKFAAASFAKQANAANTKSADASALHSAIDQSTSSSSVDHVENTTADHTRTETSAATSENTVVAHDLDLHTKADQQASADNSSSASASASNFNLAASEASQFQQAMSSQHATALVFTDLSQFNSHHLRLQVNMKAFSGHQTNVLQVFQGSDSAINGFVAFPFAAPACVAADP